MIAVGDSTIRRPAKSRSSHATQFVINPVAEVLITGPVLQADFAFIIRSTSSKPV